MLQTVVFDTYSAEPSLKDRTRISCKKHSLPPSDFKMFLERNIEKITTTELLSKQCNKKIDYWAIDAAHYWPYERAECQLCSCWQPEGILILEWSNQPGIKWADTLIMRSLKLGSDAVHTNVVNVYSADTDVFFLLLSHSNKLNCSSLFICLVKGWVDIKLQHSVLGDDDDTSKALVSLHALTGCDSTEKLRENPSNFGLDTFDNRAQWFKIPFLDFQWNPQRL